MMVCRMDRGSHLRSGNSIVLTLEKNAHYIEIFIYSIINSA